MAYGYKLAQIAPLPESNGLYSVSRQLREELHAAHVAEAEAYVLFWLPYFLWDGFALIVTAFGAPFVRAGRWIARRKG